MRRFSIFALRTIVLISLFQFSCFELSAQYQELVNYKIEITEGMIPANEGTFQILVDPKYRPVFTMELLYFVEANRKNNKDVWIKLMPCAELYIPSREKINSPDFTPFAVTAH